MEEDLQKKRTAIGKQPPIDKGEALEVSASLREGKLVGGYRLLESLGHGGMAIVYKAVEERLNRVVALKILPPHLVADKELLQRFHNEAQAAAQLNHPNIVQIYAIGEADGYYYIAMEHVQGRTLEDIVTDEGSLQINRAIDIAIQIAEALVYSHSAGPDRSGVIHRDIKSTNILIDAHGRIKVTDFGIARIKGTARLTTYRSMMGTPEFMSPEQALGEDTDQRTDIYSFGVVLYEMFTGRVPFEADSPAAVANMQVNKEPLRPTTFRKDIPPSLRG